MFNKKVLEITKQGDKFYLGWGSALDKKRCICLNEYEDNSRRRMAIPDGVSETLFSFLKELGYVIKKD